MITVYCANQAEINQLETRGIHSRNVVLRIFIVPAKEADYSNNISNFSSYDKPVSLE